MLKTFFKTISVCSALACSNVNEGLAPFRLLMLGLLCGGNSKFVFFYCDVLSNCNLTDRNSISIGHKRVYPLYILRYVTAMLVYV